MRWELKKDVETVQKLDTLKIWSARNFKALKNWEELNLKNGKMQSIFWGTRIWKFFHFNTFKNEKIEFNAPKFESTRFWKSLNFKSLWISYYLQILRISKFKIFLYLSAQNSENLKSTKTWKNLCKLWTYFCLNLSPSKFLIITIQKLASAQRC